VHDRCHGSAGRQWIAISGRHAAQHLLDEVLQSAPSVSLNLGDRVAGRPCQGTPSPRRLSVGAVRATRPAGPRVPAAYRRSRPARGNTVWLRDPS